MAYIEFVCSLKALYLLGNGIFYYYICEGDRNLYSLMISMIFAIILCIFLLYYNKKSVINESKQSKIDKDISISKVLYEGDKMKVINVNQEIDYSLGLSNIVNIYYSYGIIFLLYFILNILSYLRAFYSSYLRIVLFYEFLSLVAMIFTYYTILKIKLFRHHLFGLFIIIIFSIFIFQIEYKDELSIFSIIFWSYNGAIQCFIKLMMLKYYVNPYIVSIANSFMQILLDTSKILTDKFIPPNNSSYHNNTLLSESYYNFSRFSNSTILKQSIEFTIGNTGNVILNSLIIYYYPPFVYPASNDIGNLISLLLDFNNEIEKKKIYYSIGKDIGICILAELIILNFLGLGFNTKKNIEERSKKITEKDAKISDSSLNISLSVFEKSISDNSITN